MLTQMSLLISSWSSSELSLADSDLERKMVYRTSCKVDSAMIVLLGRPNARIRRTVLTILSDMYTVCEAISPHLNVRI